MDRRTILFIILVCLAFFGLNIYFSYDRNQKNRVILQEQQAKRAKQTKANAELIKARTATLSSLPLTTIYSDQNKSQPLAQAINVEGNTLTLAWKRQPPKEVYVNGQKQRLVTDQDMVIDGPIVYANENFKNLNIALLPKGGSYDVQLLSFNPEDQSVSVVFGEYRDGDISIPSGPLKANAIALYKTNKGYLPLGFYEWRERAFIELQNLPLLADLTTSKKQENKLAQASSTEEKFYVLENEYQQLVFSNVGGAITAINLPLKSDEHPNSVVNEIGFERDLIKESPQNTRFPLQPYFKAGDTTEQQKGQLGGYYPLLRRSILGKKKFTVPPQSYALNIVSEYPEMAELVYEVKEFTRDHITFEATQPHRRITKTFRLDQSGEAAPYVFDLEINIEGDRRGLSLTSGVPEVEIMSNHSNPQIMYRMIRKQKSDIQKLSLPKANETVSVGSISPDWIVSSNGYLGVIVDPLNEKATGFEAKGISGSKAPTRLSLIDPKYEPYPASKYPGYQLQLPLSKMPKTIELRVYAGPFEEKTLKTVDGVFADPSTGYNPDYIAARTFHGWLSFISEPFSKLLFVVLKFFHSITRSWGFSIILLTIFLRLVLYPLNAWSIKSMRRMQQVAPQVKAIQKKYKKDAKKSQMEIMALYRAEKVNPFTGCIPIVIQIPFLIAMFDLLKSSFQLRGASFIPGWIDNLTAPDVLFQWDMPIFFIGNQFHLLPILLGVVMFIQQRLSSAAARKKHQEMTDQERQQRTMGTVMTVVFTVMFYHFPSGLNLYWLSSMSLGILQQWITNKLLDKKEKKNQVISK